jgi:hypothetical protein
MRGFRQEERQRQLNPSISTLQPSSSSLISSVSPSATKWWQFAIGTGVHIADEQGDCFLKIAPVKIIEDSLLAPLDIFVARHVSYQGTFHFRSPNLVINKTRIV